MTTKILEAKAVITAQDKTGAVFDGLAKKFKDVARTANAFGNIKAPQHTVTEFAKGLEKIKISGRPLAETYKTFQEFDKALRSAGPVRASHYLQAVGEWQKSADQVRAHAEHIKASVEDVEKSRRRFMSHAGKFGVHVAGIGGGAYVAGHAIRSTAKHAAERNREEIREEQMGLTPDEKREAEEIAGRISSKFPSLDRTSIMADLRKNASRLGGFDRAKAVAETYARARIMNTISGGDEHELEQVVRAAEGAGAANTPDQFRDFLNSFARAKASNPDYTGEDFAKDYRAMGASKYALSKDYRENVFPVLASHTSGFGVKLATGLSAMVGGRMTKAAKAHLKSAGLIGKDGKLVDEKGFIENNFEWTQQRARPQLEKQGVHFSEHMSDEDKEKVVNWASKSFSAKNVADLIITNLLDAPLVERARQRKTNDLESADDLQKKDAGLAATSVAKQVQDLGVAVTNTTVAIDAMNKVASDFAAYAEMIRTGKVPETTPGLKRIQDWFTGDQKPLDGAIPLPMIDPRKLPGGAPDAKWQMGASGVPWSPGSGFSGSISPDSKTAASSWAGWGPKRDEHGRMINPGVFDKYVWGDPKLGTYPEVTPTMTYGTGVGGDHKIEALLTGSAEVHGEVTVKTVVEASSELLRVVQQAEKATAKLNGMYSANGPGSLGHSSPDAAAPPPRSGGAN